MYRMVGLVLVMVVVAWNAVAAEPVATVTSKDAFVLRGTRVPVDGVPSWPLVVGDEIATTTSPAAIAFLDKSSVTLDKNSRIKLEQGGKLMILRLLDGSLSYSIAPGSQVNIFARQEQVGSLVEPDGSVSIVGDQVKALKKGKGKGPPFDPPGPPPRRPPRSGSDNSQH